MSWKDWTAVGAVAICALGVIACGDSGGGGGATASADEARLRFAECMREHGVDMPDPQPGGGFLMTEKRPGGGGPERGTSLGPGFGGDPVTREAMESCEKFLADAGPRNFTPEQRREFQEAALAFAECMREHGVDMPDPQFGADGKVTMTMKAPRRDGAAEAAQEACQDEMPAPPGAPAP